MKWMKELRELSHYFTNCKLRFYLSMLWGLLDKVAGLGGAMIGALIVALALSGDMQGGTALAIGLFICILARAVFSYLEMIDCHDVAYHILEIIRGKLYRAIHAAAPLCATSDRTGSLSAAVVEDVEVLEGFYAHTMGYVMYTVVFMSLVLALLFIWSPLIAGVILCAAVAVLLIPMMLKKWGDRLGQQIREATALVNAETVDSVQGLREIVLFEHQEKILSAIAERTKELNRLERKEGVRKGLQAAFLNLSMSLALIGTALICHESVSRGGMLPHLVPVLMILTSHVFAPVVGISGALMGYPMVLSAMKRIRDLLEMPPNADYPLEDLDLPVDASITFKDVVFSYDKKQRVLDGVNFSCAAGKKMAVTGASGTGKTTLAKLLLRFYDVDGGEVAIGGCNIKNLKAETLASTVSYVSQEVYLFNKSVMENIRMVSPEAADSEVIQATKQACAHDFIMRMPEGYHTVVGERGVRLSGGEKQRISIARALLKDTPIIILDEAVSNLDSENEALFMKALKSIQNKTILLIAHRESTLQEADIRITLKTH